MKKLIISLSALLFVSSCNNVTELPQVTTTNPIVSDTAVIVGGDVTFTDGDINTIRGVCWSTSPNPTTADIFVLDTGVGMGEYYLDIITQVNPNNQYFVKAYAENSVGKTYGNERIINFTSTATQLPQVTTTNPIESDTAFIVGGDVTFTDGDINTIRGVCWSTSPNPTTNDNFKLDSSNGAGIYAFDILAQLTFNTQYYFRAYAENSVGKAYGNEVSFKTNYGNPFGAIVNANGCIECDNYAVGDTFVLNQNIMVVADRSMLDTALSNSDDLTQFCTTKLTDMSLLFIDNKSFNQDISSWDVSNVTTMQLMFFESNLFNQDISNWDVSNVTDMVGMFAYTNNFNQDIGNWDVSNVTNMTGMFNVAATFNQDLTQWCVSYFSSMPVNFSTNSALTASNHPVWGTCP